jgi:hypothetical protein
MTSNVPPPCPLTRSTIAIRCFVARGLAAPEAGDCNPFAQRFTIAA